MGRGSYLKYLKKSYLTNEQLTEGKKPKDPFMKRYVCPYIIKKIEMKNYTAKPFFLNL